MKWHIYTKEDAPFEYETYVEIDNISDVEFIAQYEEYLAEYALDKNDFSLKSYFEEDFDLDSFTDIFYEYNWEEDLYIKIESLFETDLYGQFDWSILCENYYAHFESMIKHLKCDLEFESNDLIKSFNCEFNECSDIDKDTILLRIGQFYCGNGEYEGTLLALSNIESFMESNKWNIGFYDESGVLVNDISTWAKINKLNPDKIKPIVWFGHNSEVLDCWKITTDTEDSCINKFWNAWDIESRFNVICKAEECFYYSLCEYGFDFDWDLFDEIQENCPINLNLSQEERNKALYELIKTEYNKCFK